jgi:hypothetical protein
MPTIMTPKSSPSRAELLQGTLDMLILRTLIFGPAHGHQIAKHIQRTTEDVLQDRCIRLCIAWSARAGSPLSGRWRRNGIANSSITGLRLAAGNNLFEKNPGGNKWLPL